MKKMKKMMALVIAMVMCLAMGVTVFADDPTYSITVTNTNDNVTIAGKTYTAYKLFDMTYQGTTTTGDDTSPHAYTISTSNPFYTNADSKAELDKYFSFTASDSTVMIVGLRDASGKAPGETGYEKDNLKYTETAARTLADALEDYLPSTNQGTATVADGAETCTINTNPNAAGYYLVYGTADSADPKSDDTDIVAAIALTSTDPAGLVNPKVDAPPLNKEITAVAEGNDEVDDALLDKDGKAAVAKVGSTVSFKLTSMVPDLRGYDDYTYIISDTMTAGLSFTGTDTKDVINGMVVKIGTTTLTLNNTNDKAKYTLTHAVDSKSFTLTIPYSTLAEFDKGTDITVEYNATVNSNALTYDYENNTASLKYSSNPYEDETNHTPDKKVYVLDLNLDVLKVDGSNTATTLDGAKFKLYRLASDGTTKEFYKWDTTNNVVTWVAEANADVFETDTDGNLKQQVRGLDKGTYYLLETEAPKGYNLLSEAVEVVISAEEGTDKVTYSATYGGEDATMTNGEVNLATAQAEAQPVATGTIENNSGAELPSTGGIGTTIFYVIGAILVLGAGILLVTRRRMNAN